MLHGVLLDFMNHDHNPTSVLFFSGVRQPEHDWQDPGIPQTMLAFSRPSFLHIAAAGLEGSSCRSAFSLCTVPSHRSAHTFAS